MRAYLTFTDWFRAARKRDVPSLAPHPDCGDTLNLGSGFSPMDDAINLDRSTGWDADYDPLPCRDETVVAIYMHGFIDYVIEPVALLRECERVLVKGGTVNIVVPHAMSELGSSDIHKKTRWTEESFPHLLENKHYKPEGSDLGLRLHAQFIQGVVWRNMSLFTQLVKD